MASSIQFKLRGFSIVDRVQDQWNQMDTPDNTFFGNLLPSFSDTLPPNETISHWLNIAAHYLLPALILIVCTCLIICISRLVVMGIYYIVKFLYLGLSCTIGFIYTCLLKCSCMGPPAVKMMVAPGRAPLMIARAAFEVSPKAYFAALRIVSG